MQTFLPYSSFFESAYCLDRARLGKQRVEAMQLLAVLDKGEGGWINHPAARMWRGHQHALAEYGRTMCLEWRRRGYTDNLLTYFQMYHAPTVYPPWLGDEAFHTSHRSNLLRKDPTWYAQWHWNVPSDLPYIWPVDQGSEANP